MASQPRPTPNPELDAFNRTMDHLLSVPREEMLRRLEASKAEADKNPKKRGPKARAKQPAANPD